MHGAGTRAKERQHLLELSATYADDHNGLSTRREIGDTRTQALIAYAKPFGLQPEYDKSGVLHVKSRAKVFGDEPTPDIKFPDGNKWTKVAAGTPERRPPAVTLSSD